MFTDNQDCRENPSDMEPHATLAAQMLDERQAAGLLNCSVAALRRWRQEGRGPAFYRVGRLVRYFQRDLEDFLSTNRVEPRGGVQ